MILYVFGTVSMKILETFEISRKNLSFEAPLKKRYGIEIKILSNFEKIVKFSKMFAGMMKNEPEIAKTQIIKLFPSSLFLIKCTFILII
jgi:hypothetical protein